MDIWVLLIPTLRVALYAAVIGVIGTFLFSGHFWNYQSDRSRAYCSELLQKLSMVGVLTSAALFFAVSGNMGGTFMSAFSPELLAGSGGGSGYGVSEVVGCPPVKLVGDVRKRFL